MLKKHFYTNEFLENAENLNLSWWCISSGWYTSDFQLSLLIFQHFPIIISLSLASLYRRNQYEVSVAGRLQLASCWNVLQIFCQPLAAYGVHRNENHWE